MAALNNSAIDYESGQSQQPFAAMTDSGDQTTFTLASKPWSSAPGYEFAVVPYGLATGGAVTPAVSASNDVIDMAAATVYMPGATGASTTTGLLSVVSGYDISITRGGSGQEYMINSLTVDSSGNKTVVTAASGHASAFSETRGAAGGPPFIPVGSIEVAQIRTTASGSAAISSDEIFQVVGVHQERYDQPVWSETPLEGKITFASALPAIHTGGVPKSVRARVATPIFAELPRTKDWVPAETSNTVNSEQYYDGPIGSTSSSIGQASFTISLGDGVTDALLSKKGQNIIFRFRPDKNKTAYQLTKGIVGISRTYPVGGHPTATVTVSADKASVDFAS